MKSLLASAMEPKKVFVKNTIWKECCLLARLVGFKDDGMEKEKMLLVPTPNPYELPKPLGFNLRKAIAYAKEHGIEVREIPAEF